VGRCKCIWVLQINIDFVSLNGTSNKTVPVSNLENSWYGIYIHVNVTTIGLNRVNKRHSISDIRVNYWTEIVTIIYEITQSELGYFEIRKKGRMVFDWLR
jgi:hypothetical protein